MNIQAQADLQNKAIEIQKLLRHMALTMQPLELDVNFAGVQLLNDEKNGKQHQQFWRRTVIRCLLAATEALLWNMKHITPQIAFVSRIQLTPAELEVVEEERTVNINGKIEIRKKFLPFRDNLKMTFLLFGKVHGLTVAPNYDQGFDALCETYDLRSRLMHPKKPFDPNVSDSSITAAQLGINWFIREYHQLMKRCEETIPKISTIA